MLSRSLIEHGLRWRWTPRAILRKLHATDTEVLVARRAGVLVGFALMQLLEDEAHLLLFGVDRANQRSGVGTALLRWLERSANTAMVNKIVLEVRRKNRQGRAFYRAQGYQEVELLPGYYDGEEDAIRMEVQVCTLWQVRS